MFTYIRTFEGTVCFVFFCSGYEWLELYMYALLDWVDSWVWASWSGWWKTDRVTLA